VLKLEFVLKNNAKSVEDLIEINVTTDVAMAVTTKTGIGRAVDLKETTVVVVATEVVAIGNAPSVTTQTLHLELNATDAESLAVLAVEITVVIETTEEEANAAIKIVTDKVDGSKETTVDVEMTEVQVTGNVQNVETQTLHLEQNVIAVESLEALAVDVDLTEGMIEAIKTATDKVGVSKGMTTEERTEAVAIGIALNVETQTLPSEPNAINADYHAVVVTIVDEAETIVDVVEKHTTTTIGIVQSAKTQTSPSEQSATVVEHRALAAVVEELAMTTVEDRRVEMSVLEPLTVKMEVDRRVVMVETEELKAVMETEVHTIKTEHLSVSQENLAPLENHEEMAQAMRTINLQNQSGDVETMTHEGQPWVQNITILTP